MHIGLIDVDGHNFPNLCLMKISAWHNAQGDTVEWHNGFVHYDRVYMSRVFTDEYSADAYEPTNADEILKGGTGYNNHEFEKIIEYEQALDGMQDGLSVGSASEETVWHQNTLISEMEHTYPDYALYPEHTKNTAYGFLTRGCPRGCKFCIVAEKEGRCSRHVDDLEEFWRGQRHIKLLDPNLLACKEHVALIEQLIRSGAWVDFTQGLDARCITPENAALLAKVKTKMVHFAMDSMEQISAVERGLRIYAKAVGGVNYRKARVYILTNFNTTHEQDMERVSRVQALGYRPYIMIYNKSTAPRITRRLQRWSNNAIIYNAQPQFEQYDPKLG